MTCTTSQNDGNATVKFEGSMCVAEIAPVKQELISALGSCDSLLMDLTEATDFDTAGVQLLHCAVSSAVAAKKSIAVVGVSQDLKDAVDRIGLSFEGIVDRWEDIADV